MPKPIHPLAVQPRFLHSFPEASWTSRGSFVITQLSQPCRQLYAYDLTYRTFPLVRLADSYLCPLALGLLACFCRNPSAPDVVHDSTRLRDATVSQEQEPRHFHDVLQLQFLPGRRE